MTAFAQAIKPASEGGSGALAQCQELYLFENQIGDAGVAALADACARGALAQCQELSLDGNLIGDDGMTAFAQAIKPVSEGGSGALSQLKALRLYNNRIGDTNRDFGVSRFRMPAPVWAAAPVCTTYYEFIYIYILCIM